MSDDRFDLIVIGSGPGGLHAALQAAKLGKRTVLIEDRPEMGGSCVHSGTLPSKSFRESVYRWSQGSRGVLGQSQFSEPDSPKRVSVPDMARLLRRRDWVVQGEAAVVRDQLERNGVKIVQGRGRLVSAREVAVAARRFRAPFIVLAVGAGPVTPEHLKVDARRVLDSDTILGLRKVPKSMVVLGAGIIGCEYASMFAMAGTRVHLVDRRDEILASVDRELVGHLVERLTAQKAEIILEAEAARIAKTGAGLTVHLTNGRKIRTEVVLAALGRYGNTRDLGLAEVGIAVGERGLIPVNEYFQTSIPGVYAVGDVIGAPALASTSMEQGRIAACHAFDADKATLSPFSPYGIYTIPEISMVGPTEEELLARKADFVVGRARYRELARGQIVGDRWGLLKLLVDRATLKLLGVHIIGDSAANLVHIGQAVMALDGDVKYFVRTVFNYPTLAEAYKTAAFHAINQIRGRSRA